MRALFESAVQMMRRGEEGLLAVQDEWAGGHDVGGGQRCRGAAELLSNPFWNPFDFSNLSTVECLRQCKIATTKAELAEDVPWAAFLVTSHKSQQVTQSVVLLRAACCCASVLRVSSRLVVAAAAAAAAAAVLCRRSWALQRCVGGGDVGWHWL